MIISVHMHVHIVVPGTHNIGHSGLWLIIGSTMYVMCLVLYKYSVCTCTVHVVQYMYLYMYTVYA